MLGNDSIDILGSSPFLHKLYTQLCIIFATSEPSSDIIDTLRDGLDRLAEGFPWLAGTVINEGATEGVTGTYRILPSNEKIPLVVKDLRGDESAPTLEGLRQSNYPFSMLDEKIIAPCLTLNLPGNTIGLAATSAPVLAVQATFITGGLMLTVVGQHNVMDMTGQGHIIDLLSKACHNQPFTAEELSIGNMDRSKTITLLEDPFDPAVELKHQLVKPPSPDKKIGDTTTPPASSWAYVTFSGSSLEALKTQATQTKHSSRAFVSTDDAACAFIWKCTARARLHRLDSGSESAFARAVDLRQRMGIPRTYLGMFQNMAYNKDSLQHLAEQPLGAIASQLRRKLDPTVVDLAYNTRALATFQARSADKTKASATACVDSSSGIMLSSWAKINTFELDFNLGLGKPEAVRRPAFVPVESLIYIMPKSPNGEMAIGICLRDADWERLKADEEWAKYATYVG
ncbi:Trichothecene 3-O-acetyltransferase [Penicillium brasilianum]|uniref:Trichothecene 3-O-acetyltransferase n=1 Tax=Penicillium brasilianum TaxID=104259 RepID=A0A1S9R8E8_PENBI|nr:Trichothecene 3-O-acetyltransferase [Penicillium brasilianum]